MVYFLGSPSREAHDASFAAFWADPARKAALAAAEAEAGKLVEETSSVFLQPTAYSAAIDGPLAREGQVIELRHYSAAAGKGAALNARFEEGAPAWQEAGLNAVATLEPTEPRTADGEVWLMLAHHSKEAAPAAYDRLHGPVLPTLHSRPKKRQIMALCSTG